ncbi:MAG: hypothetical protein IPL03_06550 [Sterolibacteriaceae bacterium]|nr:hypothetical protein [Candidatus Methylophosphatis haderslevensis]
MFGNRMEGSAFAAINGGVIAALKLMVRRSLALALAIVTLVMALCAGGAAAATTLPVLWTAGGLSAGNDSAGQASSIAADAAGNVAVVSGPAFARSLAVTSYTPDGVRRWQQTVSPASGTFAGNWVVAAPNGDFAAVGVNVDSHGYPFGLTMVRYATDGTLLWRKDIPTGWRPGAARLLADGAGNTYLAMNSIGDGQDIQLIKFNPAGGVVWSQGFALGFMTQDYATSLAFSPDGNDVVLTGSVTGTWITALFDAASGARKWLVSAAEGTGTSDVVVDATRVYVTGRGSVGVNGFLTVIAYDRATGARLWRTDANPPTGSASGSRIALAPDGSLVVAGQTSAGGYFDWWIVAMNNNGSVKWKVRRDQALSGDELPASVFVRADGTTVVSGTGGPVTRDVLGNAYMQGVTVAYDATGTPVWEAFAKLPIAWATALPNGDFCVAGGYDALVTCWRVPGAANYQPVLTVTPISGSAPLTVTFNRAVNSDPNGPIVSFVRLSYGDSLAGVSGTIDLGDGTRTYTLNETSSHTYKLPGTYTASLTVAYTDNTSVTKTAVINVSPSVIPAQPPLITATPSSGTVPLTVALTSTATMDPNGPLINSYSVNYGDGTSSQFFLNFGDGVTTFTNTANHTYTAVGTYTATLTVTYSNATTASGSTTIVVNPVVAIPVLRSTAINLAATLQRSRVNAIGDVVVGNGSGVAVSGAVVAATWTKPGGSTVTQTATSGSTGVARFSTSGSRGTYTLTVNSISKTGYTFDSANSVLSSSIAK